MKRKDFGEWVRIPEKIELLFLIFFLISSFFAKFNENFPITFNEDTQIHLKIGEQEESLEL